MGKKKTTGNPAAKVTIAKPFCFFCDRTFDDENVLLQHQRGRHFRCAECDDTQIRGKCESVQGLIVHTLKVHGKALARVPNSLEGRHKPEANVYGMDGIPDDLLAERGYERKTSENVQPEQEAAPPPAQALAAMAQQMPPPPAFAQQPTMPAMPTMPTMPPMGMAQFGGMPGFPPMLPQGGFPPPAPGMQTMPAAQDNTPGSLHGMLGMGSGAQAGGPSMDGFQQFLASQGQQGPPAAPPADAPQKRMLPPDEHGEEDISVEERRAALPRYRGRN